MAAILKRVSQPTERAITDFAKREGRTFVKQLDVVVAAGLEALGEAPIATDEPTTAPK